MKEILGTYENGFMTSLISPLGTNEEDFIKTEFDKGLRNITVFDEDDIIAEFDRESNKKNVYAVEYTTHIIKTAYGKKRAKTYKNHIYICADTKEEALNHFFKVAKGQCFIYSNRKAENIKVTEITMNEVDKYAPCLIATE